MTETVDFERAWLAKFSQSLDESVGTEVREQVMAGSDGLTADSGRDEVISWTQGAMDRLGLLAGGEKGLQVMMGCACQYPKAGLQTARQAYEATGKVDAALDLLQKQFESFLRDTLELKESFVEEVIGRGWGLAGIREGSRIIATKIPKSGNLAAYLEEHDPERKRQYYCHCPRIGDVLKSGESLPLAYCYCGAGYYKGIWEEILQRPVEVEVLESVLDGGEVCKIAISLPPEV
jgi:predicted hydrocarbon binding protein